MNLEGAASYISRRGLEIDRFSFCVGSVKSNGLWSIHALKLAKKSPTNGRERISRGLIGTVKQPSVKPQRQCLS